MVERFLRPEAETIMNLGCVTGTSEQSPERVVIVDLDGTLSLANTFWLWVRLALSGEGVPRSCPTRNRIRLEMACLVVLRLLHIVDHDRLKYLVHHRCRALLSGEYRKSFVEATLSRVIDSLNPAVRAHLAAYQTPGTRFVLSTAAFEDYAEPLAAFLGFDGCVATRYASAPNWIHNIRERKSSETMAFLKSRQWDKATLTVITDHEDDLPLMMHSNESLIFGMNKDRYERIREILGRKGVRSQLIGMFNIPSAVGEYA